MTGPVGLLGALTARLRAALQQQPTSSSPSALFSPASVLSAEDVDRAAAFILGQKLAQEAIAKVRSQIDGVTDVDRVFSIRAAAMAALDQAMIGFETAELVEEARLLSGGPPLCSPLQRHATVLEFTSQLRDLVSELEAQPNVTVN